MLFGSKFTVVQFILSYFQLFNGLSVISKSTILKFLEREWLKWLLIDHF